MNLLIGIDPGITGAMAAINADTLQLHAVVDFPTVSEGKKQRLFTYGTASILKQWESDADRIEMVYLEKVNAMPKQGVTSMFNMGRSFGAIEGVISALNLPLTYITPRHLETQSQPHQQRKRRVQNPGTGALPISPPYQKERP